jgi:hypothetical protein
VSSAAIPTQTLQDNIRVNNLVSYQRQPAFKNHCNYTKTFHTESSARAPLTKREKEEEEDEVLYKKRNLSSSPPEEPKAKNRRQSPKEADSPIQKSNTMERNALLV